MIVYKHLLKNFALICIKFKWKLQRKQWGVLRFCCVLHITRLICRRTMGWNLSRLSYLKNLCKSNRIWSIVCVCLQDAREFLTYVPHQMRCFAPTAADDSSEVPLPNHTHSYAVVQEVFRSFLSLDYYCSCINVEAGFYCLLRWSCFLTIMFLTNTSNYVSNELISDYFLVSIDFLQKIY